jgi:hypothetical protein
VEPTKDDEVKPTKGGEGEPTKGGEVEPTNDGEMEPTNDGEGMPTKGGEVELAYDGEVEPANDGEGEPTKGGEVEPTKGGEVKPSNDGEVEREARMAVATEVEVTRESDAEEIIMEEIEEEEEPNPDGIVEAEEGVDLEVCAFGGLAIGSPPGLPSHRKPSYSNGILYIWARGGQPLTSPDKL